MDPGTIELALHTMISSLPPSYERVCRTVGRIASGTFISYMCTTQSTGQLIAASDWPQDQRSPRSDETPTPLAMIGRNTVFTYGVARLIK